MVAQRSEIALDDTERELLVAELLRIEARLEDGYRKIDEARLQGADTRRWEDLWIQLLDDYEHIYDQLAA